MWRNLPNREPATLTTFNSNCQTGHPASGKMSTRLSGRKTSQAFLKVHCVANTPERKEDARSFVNGSH
jgi:hypothetical protein